MKDYLLADSSGNIENKYEEIKKIDQILTKGSKDE